MTDRQFATDDVVVWTTGEADLTLYGEAPGAWLAMQDALDLRRWA